MSWQPDNGLHSRSSQDSGERGGGRRRAGGQERGRGRGRGGGQGRGRGGRREGVQGGGGGQEGDQGGGQRRGRGGGQRRGQGGGQGRGRGGAQVSDQRYRTQYLSQKEIESLAQSTSDDIVRCINENEPGFLAAYSHDRNICHPLVLKHLIMILYKLTTSTEHMQIASRVLAQTLSSTGDYVQFKMQLDMLIASMRTEARPHILCENRQYLACIIEIGLFAVQHIPQTVVPVFPHASIKDTVEKLLKKGEQLDRLPLRVKELSLAYSEAEEELFESKNQRNPFQKNIEAELSLDPPEHFATLPVLPKVDEVQIYAQKPFLRPNKVKGGYENWDHYLDVQFRLLREDFVAPLRVGITEHCEGKKLSNVRAYGNVTVLQPVCLFTGVGFQISFDVTKLKRVNWEHSKRLIYGSLLCLSRDNFETVIFATVVKRDAKLLAQGLVTIKFEDKTNGFQIDPSATYTMVESSAYYEAYRHVLVSLQNASADHTADTLPFKQYIVDCQVERVSLPSYLHFAGQSVFSLKETIARPKDPVSKLALSNVSITPDFSKWPKCRQTCLDRSQYEAFRVALTQEISVIQGPPGTGKTYIGLKIVEAFLRNRNVWDPKSTSPICVVCYTNHALDQFLEEIQRIEIEGKAPNIVRIGGRCKTESLKRCVLREKVNAVREQRALPRQLHKDLAAARSQLFKIKDDIDQFQKNIEISDGKVLSASNLENLMSRVHVHQLVNDKPTLSNRTWKRNRGLAWIVVSSIFR